MCNAHFWIMTEISLNNHWIGNEFSKEDQNIMKQVTKCGTVQFSMQQICILLRFSLHCKITWYLVLLRSKDQKNWHLRIDCPLMIGLTLYRHALENCPMKLHLLTLTYLLNSWFSTTFAFFTDPIIQFILEVYLH